MTMITFTCECGQTRKILNAVKHEVSRCNDCQIEHKRKKARERYRRRKGLALDYVPPSRTKKKKKVVDEFACSWLAPTPRPEPVEPPPPLTAEEQVAHDTKMTLLEKLIDNIDDDSTDDDW